MKTRNASTVNFKSVLTGISNEVFTAKTLAEAKEIMFARLAAVNVNPEQKKIMMDNVYSIDTLINLQKYLCNSLLRFEGLSVNRYSK